MLASSIPTKFPIPWANSAGSDTVRTIPTTSQIGVQAGAASLNDGFPPLNMVPVAAGGVPPFGQDMNGILRQITAWTRWTTAGGGVPYDAAFANAIGGYPKGAVLTSSTGHALWISNVDNNTSNPDTGSVLWRTLATVWSQGTWPGIGSANAQTVALTPIPTSLAQLVGVRLIIISQGTNTGPVSLNVNGLGAISVLAPGGIPLAGGALITGYPYEVVYTAANAFVMISPYNSFLDPSTAGISIVGTGAQGANLALLGNGASTANKFIRAQGGNLEIVNSGYSGVIMTLSDVGQLTVSVGVGGGGNNNVVPNLGDFTVGTTINTGFWTRLPNGIIDETFITGVPSGGGLVTTLVDVPKPFPTSMGDTMICFYGGLPPGANPGSISIAPSSRTQVAITTNYQSSATLGVIVRARGF